MKNITKNFIIRAALMIVCILPITTQAQNNQGHHQSGIIGQIEQVPGPWEVRIVSADGKLVTNIQADNTGSFEVDLKPGTYVLTPYILSLDGTGALVGVSATVVVGKKQFTMLDLFVVNGPS
jgi:hypothetical protein